MKLRHILEYEDHEIRDLLGDLETVGHADKKAFALWVRVSVPRFYIVGSAEFMPALGNPFYSSGSLELDKPLILEALKQGKFTGLGNNLDPYKDETGLQKNQEVIEFLESPSLTQFFSGQKTLDESLLNLKKILSDIVQDEKKEPTVGIVYGRPGDRDLEIKPLSSFRRASIDNKGGVFYEDLDDNSDSHWTFPFA
jgi:hypothetical protein